MYRNLIVGSALLLSFLTGPALADQHNEILRLAEETGRWIMASAQDDEAGISWPDDALKPETVGYDLGTGVSGKVLYFVALYRATGKTEYLVQANAGGDYLLHRLHDPTVFDDNPRRASLYAGIAGIGVALLNLYEVSGDKRYESAVLHIVGLLQEWSIYDGAGLRWSDEFNDLIYGEAGTVLFLAFVAEQLGSQAALRLARQGAMFLLDAEQPSGQGSFWYFRRGKDFNLPNFSHGTAGIGYVLSTMATLTGDSRFAASAGNAADYLRSIAETRDGVIRTPYGWGMDTWQGWYDFGWAHGLAGTALFFERMRQVDFDTSLGQMTVGRLCADLARINLPGAPMAEFREPAMPLDMRFGRAGVLSLLAHCGSEDSSIVATRDAIAQYIADAGIRDSNGVHWEATVPEFMGGGVAAYTGYFHGAAGIGMALLKMHAALSASPPYVTMPDDPYSWPNAEAHQP